MHLWHKIVHIQHINRNKYSNLKVNDGCTLLMKTVVDVEYNTFKAMKSQFLMWNEMQIYI